MRNTKLIRLHPRPEWWGFTLHRDKVTPINQERVMRADEFIVSKTDTTGRLTSCKRIFIDYAGYSEHELLGHQPILK